MRDACAVYRSRHVVYLVLIYFFFQAEDGIRDGTVTGVQTCALPISARPSFRSISRRINTPPFDDSFPPSNVAVIVFPPTGDRPGRNSVASVMVSGASCWPCTILFRQQNHT